MTLLLNVSTVAAATGVVFWVNSHDKLGKVRDDMGDDDGTTRVYVFQIPEGTDAVYSPQVDEHVNFTPGAARKPQASPAQHTDIGLGDAQSWPIWLSPKGAVTVQFPRKPLPLQRYHCPRRHTPSLTRVLPDVCLRGVVQFESRGSTAHEAKEMDPVGTRRYRREEG